MPETAVLLTADIEALYPSIPVDEALNSVRQLLENCNDRESEMRNFVIQLLDVQLRMNYFDFDGAHYQKISGIPMGKPWAPAVACLYLQQWDLCKGCVEIGITTRYVFPLY